MKGKDMNNSWCTAAIAIAPLVFVVSTATAAPYQMEVVGIFGQRTVEGVASGSKSDTDIIDGSFTYYLKAVDTPTGPFAERAFVDKAAYVTGSYGQVKPEFGENTDIMELDARFVTDTDLIIELGYENAEDGVVNETNTTTFGFGKYLDGQTTAVLSYENRDAGFDVNTISGTYTKLTNNESTGTAFSTELTLKYIDSDPDTGYGFDGIGVYYLSDATAVGAFAGYEKIEDDDDTSFGLLGSYFFAENLAANAFYSQSKNDSRKASRIALSIVGRF